MSRASVVRVDGTVIVTLTEELRDRDAVALQEELLGVLERTGDRAVLLDLSAVQTVDSYLGRMLSDIAMGSRLMGAHTVVTGIQPAVAMILVEMGLELKEVLTALDPVRGMALLRRAQRDEAWTSFRKK